MQSGAVELHWSLKPWCRWTKNAEQLLPLASKCQSLGKGNYFDGCPQGFGSFEEAGPEQQALDILLERDRSGCRYMIHKAKRRSQE